MSRYKSLLKYCKQFNIPYKTNKGKFLKMYILEKNIISRNNLNNAREYAVSQVENRTKSLVEKYETKNP